MEDNFYQHVVERLIVQIPSVTEQIEYFQVRLEHLKKLEQTVEKIDRYDAPEVLNLVEKIKSSQSPLRFERIPIMILLDSGVIILLSSTSELYEIYNNETDGIICTQLKSFSLSGLEPNIIKINKIYTRVTFREMYANPKEGILHFFSRFCQDKMTREISFAEAMALF